MPTIQIKIDDQLLIPFGGPKWSIKEISVVGVSTTGTYLQSDTPLAYIDKSKQQALRLRDFTSVVPGDWPEIEVAADATKFIRDHLKEKCEVATNHERRFLDLYFASLLSKTAYDVGSSAGVKVIVHRQTHLYLTEGDPT